MNDIVERLDEHDLVDMEAKAEIERLRFELKVKTYEVQIADAEIERLRAENERLRAWVQFMDAAKAQSIIP